MITESFLDVCFSLLLAKDTIIHRDPSLVRNILDILDYHLELYNQDIPIQIKNKFDCLYKVCTLKMENRSIPSIIDSILAGGKFDGLKDYIEDKLGKHIDSSLTSDYTKQIRNRKKEIALFKDFNKLKDLVSSVEESRFESCDDLVGEYEGAVKSLYANMMQENRAAVVEVSASLDLMTDSYEYVLDRIKENNKAENCVPSGFENLDGDILRGGFRKCRVYLIAGHSGCGKSTFLINFLANVCKRSRISSSDDIEGVYVYVTLENLIDETFARLYCCLFNRTETQIVNDINNGTNVREAVKDVIEKSRNNICMYYFPAYSIGTEDVRILLDDISSRYGKKKIKALLVDYLDLFDAKFSTDLYRLQLAKIALDMKILSIDYDIPVITVTQVNRSGYNNEAPELTSVGEAMKKVEHVDFVALLGPSDDGRISFNVGKNRNGPRRSVSFEADLSRYRIWPSHRPPGNTPISGNPEGEGLITFDDRYDDNNNDPPYTPEPGSRTDMANVRPNDFEANF